MSLGTTQLDKMEEEAHSPDDDLSTLMVDDFGQSTVDQSEILYEFQTAQNAEEVNRILAEIISDYDCNQLPASKKGLVFCYQNCSDILWEQIVLVIEKNFWNFFWDH